MDKIYKHDAITALFLLTPPTQNFLYPYGTAIFIFLCAIIWLYLYLCLPETKGRSVEDITMELRQRTREKDASPIQNGHPDSAVAVSFS